MAQAVLDGAFDDRGMMRCDHCRTFRNRRIGIVVANEAGETQIVGSACARDYLGHDFKALIAYHQHISLIRREYDTEREVGWYQIEETDWQSRQTALAEEQAARDAAVYPLRRLIAAGGMAMAEQGFFAFYSGSGKTATATAAEAILVHDRPPSGVIERATQRVLAWLTQSGRYVDYGAWAAFCGDPDGSWSLAAYKAVDPNFRLADSFIQAGHPLVGELRSGRVETELLRLRAEEAVNLVIETAYGSKDLGERTRHVLRDREGALFIWETASHKLDAIFSQREYFPAKFEVKRATVQRTKAVHWISRLDAASGKL